MMKSSKKLILTLLFLTVGWTQYPAQWVVDAHDFEHTMTLTGELLINDSLQAEGSSAVAAFHNDECRGVVEGTQVGDEVLYFLLIYGNTPSDSLEFRAWDADIGNVVLLEQAITFTSGAALGEVETPYQLSGTNNLSYIQAFDDAFVQAEDTENLLPFDLLGNDIYDRSLAMVVTFPTEPTRGMLFENVDQTFSYVSDLNFFGQDSFQYRVSHVFGADSAWVQVNITPVDDPLAEFHLLNPARDTFFDQGSNSIQTFDWEIPEDVDGDPITYSLYVYDGESLDSSYSSNLNTLDLNIEELARDTWLDWHVVAYDGWGWTTSADTFSFLVSSIVDIDPLIQAPLSFYLGQNFPNPFNPQTTLEFGLPKDNHVSIRIYNIHGQMVRGLVDENLSAGNHSANWNSQNDGGHVVPSGIYITIMESGAFRKVNRMVMLK